MYGPKDHAKLAGALFELAADCARRAVEEPPADQSGFDRWVRLTAIGQAGEMLVKSTLAGINPVLIAEKQASTRTLWELAGVAGRPPQGKVGTIGAADAVKRLNECKPRAAAVLSTPKLLFEVRNDAQHLALSPTENDLDAALTELVTLVDGVFKIREALGQPADPNVFWSSKHLGIVEARRKAGYESLLERYGEAISEARSIYAKLIAGLSDNDRIRVVGELQSRPPVVVEDQTIRKHNCPACGNYLWVVYDVEREVDIDDSDAPDSFAYIVTVSATVSYVECPVCNLYLEQDELVLTDVEFNLDLGTDVATADEEQGWRDARDAEAFEEAQYADLGPPDEEGEYDGRD